MSDLGWDALWEQGRERETAGERHAELRARLRERLPELTRGGMIHPLKGGPLFRKLSDEWGAVEAEIADAAASLGAWPWTPKDVLRALRKAKGRVPPGRRKAKVGVGR